MLSSEALRHYLRYASYHWAVSELPSECRYQGAIALACNPEYHARTKHIDIQYHFIRDLVTSEVLDLRFCPSSDMIADIMTKSLPRPAHDKHTQAMGLTDKPPYGTRREGAC